MGANSAEPLEQVLRVEGNQKWFTIEVAGNSLFCVTNLVSMSGKDNLTVGEVHANLRTVIRHQRDTTDGILQLVNTGNSHRGMLLRQ